MHVHYVWPAAIATYFVIPDLFRDSAMASMQCAVPFYDVPAFGSL